MNKFSKTMGMLGVAATLGLASAAANAGDLAISVGVGGEVLPGVYGTVNVTNAHPRLVIADPVIVERRAVYGPPVYLSVPPGHARHWERYCGRYNACARPVYFVRSPEYRDFSPTYIRSTYVVRDYHYDRDDRHEYRERHEDHDGWRGRGDDDHGPGRGHGHGHGHGHDRD